MHILNEVVNAIRSINEVQVLLGFISVNIIVFARLILIRKEMITSNQALISTPVIIGFYFVILISNQSVFINVLMIISIISELKSAIFVLIDSKISESYRQDENTNFYYFELKAKKKPQFYGNKDIDYHTELDYIAKYSILRLRPKFEMYPVSIENPELFCEEFDKKISKYVLGLVKDEKTIAVLGGNIDKRNSVLNSVLSIVSKEDDVSTSVVVRFNDNQDMVVPSFVNKMDSLDVGLCIELNADEICNVTVYNTENQKWETVDL